MASSFVVDSTRSGGISPLTRYSESQRVATERLGSGSRINRAADDAAGLAISELMRSEIRGYGAAARAAGDGISLAQTADGALGDVTSTLGRMRELAVQSSSGTLSDDERAMIDGEFQQLSGEIDGIASSAAYGDQKLLNGDLAGGMNITTAAAGEAIALRIGDTSASALGIAGAGVGSQAGAQDALTRIDSALSSVGDQRAELGATQGRLSAVVRNLDGQADALMRSESQIRDADIATETAQLSRSQVLNQSSMAMMAQAQGISAAMVQHLLR